MKILVNGIWHDISVDRLGAALCELGYEHWKSIATALNGDFVPHTQRDQVVLQEGDRLEIVSPMQGG